MQARLDEAFKKNLAGYSFIDLENHPDSIFGLNRDFTLAYFNRAWFRFAAENGGEPVISRDWGLGRNVFDAIPAELTSFYLHFYKRALAMGTTVEHVYECSSPEIRRKFHQIVYPASGRALLVVNSLVVSVQIDSESGSPPPQDPRYRDENGLVYQCAHCRRIRNLKHENRWDWIGYFVKYPPPNTAHTLCGQCRGYYYHLDGLPARE